MTLADVELTPPEQGLREAMTTGRWLELRTGTPTADDPSKGARWGPERTIRAAVLADLLTRSHGSRPRALRLAGARITGRLDLEAAELLCPVLLKGCWFEQPLSLAEARAPAVRLPGCHLPGLHAAQLQTRGNVELNGGFVAQGEVDLSGAHIGGLLDLSEATLTNLGGSALTAAWLTVAQDMFCRQGFTAKGAVNLLRAHIGGSLNFDTAALSNPDGHALYAPGLTVDHGMVCREGFTARGEVSLLGAYVGAQLDLSGATLTNPGGLALELSRLRATTVFLRWLPTPPERVSLLHAQVAVLHDDPASWPGHVNLRGFAYDALYEQSTVSARQRLGWLGRDPGGYAPQPYEQLIAVYRRAGRDQDARIVAIAKQRVRRHTLPLPGKAWSLLLDALVGFGYRTWLAGVWLLGFVLAGWWLFDRAHPADLVASKPPGERPLFNGGLYALDLLLPTGDLDYQGAWIARGWARGFWLGWILAGWVPTAVVAALAGILKRD